MYRCGRKIQLLSVINMLSICNANAVIKLIWTTTYTIQIQAFHTIYYLEFCFKIIKANYLIIKCVVLFVLC